MNARKRISWWPYDRFWTCIWLLGVVVFTTLMDTVGFLYAGIWLFVSCVGIVILKKTIKKGGDGSPS